MILPLFIMCFFSQPETDAWALNDATSPHQYAECGNRGTCDRGSGTCQCEAGFTGSACERLECPNDCSGHGVCRMLQDLPNFVQDSTLSWDETSLQTCVCDGGWFGSDCSLRKCPFGDDPVTVCERDDTVEMVQQIKFSFAVDETESSTVAGIVNDEFSLSFEDYLGQNFSTRRIEGAWGDQNAATTGSFAGSTLVALSGTDGDAARRVEAALESLPNFAMRDVTVSHEGISNTDSNAQNTVLTNAYKVTFHHLKDQQNLFGRQKLLSCSWPNVCATAGCQPRERQSYMASVYEMHYADGGAVATLQLSRVNPSALKATLSDDATTATDSWVAVHEDSVLSCPTGASCTPVVNQPSAGLWIIAKDTDTAAAGEHHEIWIATMGSGDISGTDAGAAYGMGLFDTASDNELTAASYLRKPHVDNIDDATYPYQYAGKLTSANKDKFDITDFIPNTYLKFASVTAADRHLGAAVFYLPGSCEVTDQTPNMVNSVAGIGFDNVDIENIECSGRGECDRGAGTCECYEGYTGNACEMQTTVV